MNKIATKLDVKVDEIDSYIRITHDHFTVKCLRDDRGFSAVLIRFQEEDQLKIIEDIYSEFV